MASKQNCSIWAKNLSPDVRLRPLHASGCCFRDDIVQQVQKRLDEFDGIVIGSPVYYSAPTGQLISFLNRLFYATESRMAGKLGASVVSCRRGGASATFEQLNQYFTISNMPIVSSQYWNSYTALRRTMYGRTRRDCRPCALWDKTWLGC